MAMRKIAMAVLVLAALGAGGCHAGFAGIYGCTGQQKHKGMTISCPRCGNSQKVDRLRVYWPGEPLVPLLTHEWYCQECKTWWCTRGLNHYERGPGWPWKGSR